MFRAKPTSRPFWLRTLLTVIFSIGTMLFWEGDSVTCVTSNRAQTPIVQSRCAPFWRVSIILILIMEYHKHDHHRLSREEDENVPLRERVFLVRLLPGIRHKFPKIHPLFSLLLALINCCTVTLVEARGTGASDAQVGL